MQETPVLFLGQEDPLEKGIGYPLQYSWAFLIAQLIKNPPAMWETWVRSLGWEDPLEKGKATHFQYSGLENSMDCIVRGVAKSQTQLSDFHSPFHHFTDEDTEAVRLGYASSLSVVWANETQERQKLISARSLHPHTWQTWLIDHSTPSSGVWPQNPWHS